MRRRPGPRRWPRGRETRAASRVAGAHGARARRRPKTPQPPKKQPPRSPRPSRTLMLVRRQSRSSKR
jgi:hypothetical protein